MPSADQNNEIRRQKKAKQAADAHARAQAPSEQPDRDEWDRSVTGYLDLHDLSQTGPCKYYGVILKKNIVDLMKSGLIIVNIREAEPMYGNERIRPTPEGFLDAEGNVIDLRKVTAYIEPPVAVNFLWTHDRQHPGQKIMLVM